MNYWGIFFMTFCFVVPLTLAYVFREEIEQEEDGKDFNGYSKETKRRVRVGYVQKR